MSKNLSVLSRKRGLKKGIFRDLVESSKKAAWSNDDFHRVKAKAFLGAAPLLGTASFYDFLGSQGEIHSARVCSGTCCMIAGTQENILSELGNVFPAKNIGHAKCLGRCYENSAYQIGDRNFSGADDLQSAIVNSESAKVTSRPIPRFSHSTRTILTGLSLDLKNFSGSYSKLMKLPADTILEKIQKSELRGRGGAGFPIARKLAACKSVESEIKYLVCNADEGDPGAFSDRYLLEEQPFLVLLGMAIACKVIGATTAILYIRAEYPESFKIVEAAIAKIENENVAPEIEFIAVEGAGSYVCGEETALLSSLEGQRPEVRVRPPYPVTEGLFLKPTVVTNVETLACLPFIIENGGEIFASLGSKFSTGTKLVSLDGVFNKPGVFEVDMGISFSQIVRDLGRGTKVPVKAFQIGGPLGGIVPYDQIEKLHLDFESFQSNGFLLGHASVVCIPESFPMIEYIKHLFEFTASESCGKCFPCRIGATRGYELVNSAASKKSTIDSVLFDDLLETLELGSLCALGGGLPLPIKNAMLYFKDELQPYFGSIRS